MPNETAIILDALQGKLSFPLKSLQVGYATGVAAPVFPATAAVVDMMHLPPRNSQNDILASCTLEESSNEIERRQRPTKSQTIRITLQEREENTEKSKLL